MIFPDVTLEQWLEENDLEVLDYVCPKCKKTFRTEVPIMTKDSNGLMSPEHGCGPNYWSAILTPRTQEALDFWNQII